MANKVLFKTGTAAAFKNLTTKTAGQIYFVPQTDSSPLSGEIYFDYDANTRIIMGNTTGSLNDTSNKIYLVGATAQQNAAYTVSNSQVYMMGGTLTANVFSGKWGGTKNDIGASNQPIYLSSGTFTASDATIGSTDTPIYMKNGVLTSTGKKFSSYLPLAGGTMTGNITFAAPKTAGQKVGFTFNGVTDSASVYYLEPNLSDDGRIRLEIADNPDDAIEFAWRLWNPEDFKAYGSNPFVRHKFTFNGYNTGGTITSSSAITGGSLASNGTLSVKGSGTFGGDVTASTFHGNLDGSADKLDGEHASAFVHKAGTETITGDKTFSTTSSFTYSGMSAASDSVYRHVWFNWNGVNGRPVYDDKFQYNPGTGSLKVNSITGNAATASKVNKKLIIDEKEFDGSSEVEAGNTVNYYAVTGEAAKSASGKYYPALWKCSTDLTIRDGLIVSFKMPTAGHDFGCMLSIDNGTTYHPISQSTQFNGSRLTTHYPNGSTLFLIYSSTWVTNGIFPAAGGTGRSNITGSWIVLNGYNSDTQDTFIKYAGETTGTTGLWANTILLRTSDGRWSSVVTSSSTATTHTKSSELFMLGSKIWWTPYSVGANTALHTALRSIYSFRRRIDFRYSSNCGTTLTAGKPVYLVGKVNNGYFALDDTWWTQTLPTSEDGKVYVLVGGASNTYQVDLYENNEWYWFKGGSIRPYGGSGGKITFGDVNNPLYTYDGTNNINIPLYDGTTA